MGSFPFLLLLLAFSSGLQAQKYITCNGYIKFYSDSPLEKIEAHNRQVNVALDGATGDFVFKVLMKSFSFEKALMQEHFNENYVESDKYPNATFLGKISDIKAVNFSKNGSWPVEVRGKLTLHGITKEVVVKGTLEVAGDKVQARSKFNLLLADFGITIPAAVVNNISKSIEITVDCSLDKFNL